MSVGNFKPVPKRFLLSVDDDTAWIYAKHAKFDNLVISI